MPCVKLTILNGMADRDIAASMDASVNWGLTELDLKDSLFGKDVSELSDEEAEGVRDLARARGLHVTCLSSKLFQEDLEAGEDFFRARALGPLDRLLRTARVLEPTFVRLLPPRTLPRAKIPDGAAHLRDSHPWLVGLFREAVDRIAAAGFSATLENERGGCILAHPAEIRTFFGMVDRPGRLSLTWDAANMWQAGTLPDLAVYESLKPLIRYVHVKGGRADTKGGIWRSALSDSSWPVLEVVRRVVDDGVSPVICLNPSHGKRPQGFSDAGLVERDIQFLRENVPGIE